MTDPVTGSVRIGAYALEVGARSESYAVFERERENRNAKALRDALDEERGDLRSPAAALEGLQASAEAVTARCERAHELFRAAAEGRLLEPGALMAEVDSLLGLAERLDRQGRFADELRLVRALHGLLALARRWLDLIRALRRALSAADHAGDLAGQAWVRHELGSLHLCAGEPEAAAEQLRLALRLQQHLGQASGACATRHNLDSAERDVATLPATTPWPRRLLRLATVVGVLTGLAVGGTAIALAQDGDRSSPTAPTTTQPTTGIGPTPGPSTGETTDPTNPSTPGTSSPVDATAPDVTLDCPDQFGRSLTIECTLTSTEAGTATLELRLIRSRSTDEVDVETTLGTVGTVELEPDVPRAFDLTLPEQTEDPPSTTRAFVVVATQSDAAGNSDTASERVVPFSIE